MNILMVNATWYPSGGDWTYISSICNLYEKNGHKIIPFAMKDSRNFNTEFEKYFVTEINYASLNEKISFKNIFKALYRSIYSRESIKNLNKLLDEHQVDLAQLNNIHNIQTPAIISVLKKRKIPVVWRILDYKILCPNRTFLSNNLICEKCFKTKYYNCFLNKCKKNSYSASLLTTIETYFNKLMPYYDEIDFFLFQSEFSKNLFYKYGYDINKMSIIENPYDADEIIPQYNNIFHENNYILYFGRISQEKGLMTLYQSMKNLPDINLKVIGDGPYLEESKNYIKINKLSNIEFLGPKWGDSLEPYIRNCEFVVLPSEWYEPNPYVVLQSFSFGKTVIATNIGGIKDMIKNDINGILCEPFNHNDLSKAIIKLYNDHDKIIYLGKNARKILELKYNPKKYYDSTMQLFNNLIVN